MHRFTPYFYAAICSLLINLLITGALNLLHIGLAMPLSVLISVGSFLVASYYLRQQSKESNNSNEQA